MYGRGRAPMVDGTGGPVRKVISRARNSVSRPDGDVLSAESKYQEMPRRKKGPRAASSKFKRREIRS